MKLPWRRIWTVAIQEDLFPNDFPRILAVEGGEMFIGDGTYDPTMHSTQRESDVPVMRGYNELDRKISVNSLYASQERHNLVEEGDLNSMKYLFQCFVGHEDTFTSEVTIPGPEAIYTGTFEQPRIMLARTDLPGGPMGDEMWYRLTVGLERKVIQW